MLARRRSSSSSPVIEYSLANRSLPRPTPSVSRPPLSRSSVAVSRATLTGLRRASGVTIGPSRIRSVAVAIAASVIHGSATSTTGSRQRTWSQANTPFQPASSASAARRAAIDGSASSSKSGTKSPERMRGTLRDRGDQVPEPVLEAVGAVAAPERLGVGLGRPDRPLGLVRFDAVDRRDGEQRPLEGRPVGELVGDLDLVSTLGDEPRGPSELLEHSGLAGRGTRGRGREV